MPKPDAKHKLTLGISKDVVDKAKAAGINISEITEQLLKAITYRPKGNTRDDVIKAYTAFFDITKGILQRYGGSIVVGDYIEAEGHQEQWDIILSYTGLWKEPASAPEYSTQVDVPEVLFCLDPPNKILEKLIVALIEAAEENKEKLAELDFALRFVKTLVDDKKKSVRK